MKRIIYWIEDIMSWWVIGIGVVLYAIDMYIYRNSIEVFDGRAVDVGSSLSLIFEHPQEAAIAIATGIVAYVIVLLFIGMALAGGIGIISTEISEEKVRYIVACGVLGLVLGITNGKYVDGFWILLISIVLVCAIVYFLFSDN